MSQAELSYWSSGAGFHSSFIDWTPSQDFTLGHLPEFDRQSSRTTEPDFYSAFFSLFHSFSLISFVLQKALSGIDSYRMLPRLRKWWEVKVGYKVHFLLDSAETLLRSWLLSVCDIMVWLVPSITSCKVYWEKDSCRRDIDKPPPHSCSAYSQRCFSSLVGKSSTAALQSTLTSLLPRQR